MKEEKTDKKARILVVDDEPDLCEILKFNLEVEGYEVEAVGNGEEALSRLTRTLLAEPFQKGSSSSVGDEQPYSLLLLDVMMPGLSGFAVARQLKLDERLRDIPIIFLTARDSENDVITGLNLGADDYIAKPFRLRELLARVKAVLRRTDQVAESHPLSVDGLVVNDLRKVVAIDGDEVMLTRTEFDLLSLLLSERGRVFSRQELLQRAWPQDVVVTERTVDVCVTRLRKKIGRFAKHVVTKSGFGYSFE